MLKYKKTCVTSIQACLANSLFCSVLFSVSFWSCILLCGYLLYPTVFDRPHSKCSFSSFGLCVLCLFSVIQVWTGILLLSVYFLTPDFDLLEKYKNMPKCKKNISFHFASTSAVVSNQCIYVQNVKQRRHN